MQTAMHLWWSSSFKDYTERQKSGSRAIVDGCPIIVSIVQCPFYGVQSTCLNPKMDTDPPVHMPFEEFDYGTNGNDGNDYDCDYDDNNET